MFLRHMDNFANRLKVKGWGDFRGGSWFQEWGWQLICVLVTNLCKMLQENSNLFNFISEADVLRDFTIRLSAISHHTLIITYIFLRIRIYTCGVSCWLLWLVGRVKHHWSCLLKVVRNSETVSFRVFYCDHGKIMYK